MGFLSDTYNKAKKKTVDAWNNDASGLGIAKNMVMGLGGAAKEVFTKGPGQALSDHYNTIAKNPTLGTAVRFPEELAKTMYSGTKDFVQTAGSVFGEGLAYGLDKNVRDQYEAGNTEILPTISSVSPLQMMGKTVRAMSEVWAPKGVMNLAWAKAVVNPTRINKAIDLGTRVLKGAAPGYAYDVSNRVSDGADIKEKGTWTPGMGTGVGALFGAGMKPTAQMTKEQAQRVVDGVGEQKRIWSQFPEAVQNSFNNRFGTPKTETIPKHFIPGTDAIHSAERPLPSGYAAIPGAKADSWGWRRLPNGETVDIPGVKAAKVMPEQTVTRPAVPTLSQILQQSGEALPRPGMSIQDVSGKVVAGSRVRSAQRGNIGTVMSIDESKGTAKVFFRNKNKNTKATVEIPLSQLSALNGKPNNTPNISNTLSTNRAKFPTIEEFVAHPKTKTRGFVETARQSENIAPEVKSVANGEYTPITNKEAFANADAAIGDKFEQAVWKAKNDDTVSLQAQSEALRLMDELQNTGRMQDAIDILENISRRATEGGQATQILSAINRLKPEGILLFAQRSIERARKTDPARFGNLSLSPEKASELRKMAENISAMTPGDEKTMATYKMIDEVGRIVPSSWAKKLTTFWKAGLLTGIKGAVGGNTVGNMANVIMRKLSDVPATMLDTAIAQVTGNRSKAFTLRGLFSGAKEGAIEGVKNFRMGVGAQDVANKLDYQKVYFDTPLVQKYVDSVFNFYSASDRPYYYAALQNSLNDLAIVTGKNQGLKGNQLSAFVEKMVKEPTDEILTRALEEAQVAVFQDKTAIGSALSGMKQGLKKHGGAVGEIASEVIAPFTGVPSSIATAVHRYSPTGAVQGIYKAIVASNAGNFDQMAQRTLVDSLGKATTGTGLIWLGMQLTGNGQMTLGYPTDPGERSLWEMEGKKPYSIKIGGKWRSLNYTGAVMSLLSIGGEISKAYSSGKEGLSAIGQGLLGSGKAILSSSPLQGAQGGMNAVTDPQRYGDSYFRNLTASGVPTLIKDFASAGDRTQREVNTVGDAILNRIPGTRNGLLPQRDVFGNSVENPSGPVSSIIDPFRSSEDKSNPLITELRRLQDAGFGPTLSKPEADIKALGEKMKLTPEELNAFELATGQKAQETVNALIASTQYQGLQDEDKKKLIDDAINAIRRGERERLILERTGNVGAEAKAQTQGTTPGKNYNLELEKAAFEQSSENLKDLGDIVLRKNPDGTSRPQRKAEYNLETANYEMTAAKDDDDVEAWMAGAEKKAASIKSLMLDPSVDQNEKMKYQHDLDSLVKQYAKVQKLGDFTGARKAKGMAEYNRKADLDALKLKVMNQLSSSMKVGKGVPKTQTRSLGRGNSVVRRQKSLIRL